MCLCANLAPSRLSAEPGEGGHSLTVLEGLEPLGHLVHYEKFTKSNWADSETGFCFDSLTLEWGKKSLKMESMVGTSRHKWSFGESTKFPKAPPLQLSGQESDACVCVRVCSRVRVGRLRVPTFPRFEQAPTPGRETGRRRRPPLARCDQLRPHAGPLEPRLANCGRHSEKGRSRTPKSWRQTSGGA